MSIKRNPETGKIIAKRFSLQELQHAAERYVGFCLACGADRDCCEPDARRYPCDECELNQVYGAEELILMGRVKRKEAA